MALCTCFQFAANGLVKKVLVGDANGNAPLSPQQQLIAGFLSGAASASLCSPLELVMIQQQRKGGTLLDTTLKMLQGGHIFRGTIAMAAREGLCAAAQFSGAQFSGAQFFGAQFGAML